MRYTYGLHPGHSTVGFAARHMMGTTVRGKFTDWEGQVEVQDRDPTTAVITMTIHAASIDSGNEMRDNDLRTHILDVANHPQITYRSTQVVPERENRYRVVGDLTIAGQARGGGPTRDRRGLGASGRLKSRGGLEDGTWRSHRNRRAKAIGVRGRVRVTPRQRKMLETVHRCDVTCQGR